MKAGKKLASILVAGSMMLSMACCYAASAHQIEKQTKPIYYSDMEPENKGEVDLFFVDGVKDVPYITVETAKDILVRNVRKMDAPNYDLTVKKEGEKITLSRETYYPVTFDCKEDTITFWDYDAFMSSNPNATLMDLVAVSGFNDKGEAELFQRTDNSFQLYGETITFHPGDYGIDMFYQDGEYYLPLQLFSDIILAPSAMNTLYNGENVFLMFSGNLKPFEEIYYNAPAPEKRSEALANFNYNELCFALDSLYGLKEQHNIKKFDTMFQQAGIKHLLLSADPQEAGQALCDLTFMYLDDLHSSFANRSYRMKEKPTRRFGPACRQSIADMKRYADARAKMWYWISPIMGAVQRLQLPTL